jgi:predicted TPR repeat methyltransferase
MNQGRIADGLLANSKAITYSPRHLQARDQVIRALLLQGEREQAAGLYREWLAEEPDNPVIQHQLAACLGEAAPERASNAYVEQVFDSFARSFDVKLEKLHYHAPELVTEALRAAAGEPEAALDLCDAGCGTGLCGPLVRPWARHLVGCDLSVGMLKQARPRQVYDALHQAELVYYLDTQPAAFDVIVSADTLCYFGELGAAMAAAHKALRSGGWLIYTVEALPEGRTEPHVLQPTGRYAHGRGHLEQVARQAGLVWHGAQAVELRMEAGKPVHGWLVTARR